MKMLVQSIFLLGGFGYLALCILVLVRLARLPAWPFLLLALGASLVWLNVQMLLVTDSQPSGLWMLGSEAMRDLAWLALLARLLPESHRYRKLIVYSIFSGMAATIGLVIAGLLGLASADAMMLMFLFLAAVMLMASEQLYRGGDTEGRWAVKFLSLGVGLMSVYDVYLYAQGLLLHSLDIEILRARGVVQLAVLPLLGVSIRRLASMGDRVAVALSGRGASFSLALFAVGAYLLAVAAGGYLVRFVGGEWSRYWEIVFLFLALLLLVVVLASGRFRAWLRVMTKKHLLPYRYDYREEWLRLLRDLHSPTVAESVPERGIAAIANLVESPAGIFWVLEQNVGVFRPLASWGRPLPATRDIPVELPGLQPLFERHWVLVFDEENEPARERFLLKDAWMLVPVLFEEQVVGLVELAQARLPHDLEWEDYDLLRLAGMEVGAAFVQHRDAAQLAEAGQFEAYHKMAAFVLHDIKNIVQQLSLLLKNATRHRDNPEFIDLSLRTIENSVKRMNVLIARMREGSEARERCDVDPSEVVDRVVKRCRDREPRPVFDAETGLHVHVDPERFDNVIEHLIRNAQDATPEPGDIHVSVRSQCDRVVVEIRDNGCGMSQEFLREKYFKPFESQKKHAGMGIGAYQAREFARHSGGDLLVESEPGHGTVVRMILPKSEGG